MGYNNSNLILYPFNLTDLAARGIYIPELKFIIHYELALHKEEFIYRNGRIARVDEKGTAYISKRESLNNTMPKTQYLFCSLFGE